MNKPIAMALLVAVSAIIRSLFGSDRPIARLGEATGPCLFGSAQCKSLKREEVIFSDYSQRPDKATGRVGDEYLFSIQISRKDCEEIDFNQLSKVDVVESLTRFELRRQMSKTGIFKPIIPFGN